MMKRPKNEEIRLRILHALLHYRDVAQVLGMDCSSFTDLLDTDLSEEQKSEILDAIERIKPNCC